MLLPLLEEQMVSSLVLSRLVHAFHHSSFCLSDSFIITYSPPPAICHYVYRYPSQVLRNIGGINPDASQRMDFKHGKNAQFAGPGPAKTMINQGVRVYEVAFWVSCVYTNINASFANDSILNRTLPRHPSSLEQAAQPPALISSM